MDEQQRLAEQFEEHRARLRAVAYRLLGSLTEADDAVQEAWLRLSRTDAKEIENLGAWLTTVVSRVSLTMLRARRSRHEEPWGPRLPEPIIDSADGTDPEHEAILADSVGLAMLVLLETLNPAERIAFVLHDMFAMPFADIAAVLGRSPESVRQLASRARRRVRGAAPASDADVGAQRAAIDAFMAAARDGDFDALVAVLDPDVVLRVDSGPSVPADASLEIRGAETVARRALTFARLDLLPRAALVNGEPGVVSMLDGRPFSVGGFTVRGGRITELYIVADPDHLRRLDLSALDS